MKLFFSGCAAIALITIFSFSKPQTSNSKPKERKIQVAILLDVSNSMDGLIEQAKAQLWDMVITLGKAQCDDKTIPNVEVALYEYGRPANGADKGFVRQLSSFTNDLDSVSKLLFGLVTNGGDEYCGQVIFNSIDELQWDSSPDNYKVIFIAGNEDFLQGTLHYTKSCDKAKNKGVIVNTIYCGSYEQGIREHWNLLGECGNGSYTNINKDAKEIIIPTPYDSTMIVLNGKLNTTYVGYGALASRGFANQAAADQMNFSVGSEMQAKRIAAKAQKNAYWNGTWDMIDAYNADSTGYFKKLDKKTLPDSLQNRSTQELKTFVWEKSKERTELQNQINTISVERNKYIEQKKIEMRTTSSEPTLESAVNKILREQVKRCNMVIQ
jgi:hypothetical protein